MYRVKSRVITKKLSKLHLAVIAIIAGALGSYVVFFSSAATATANLWVAPTGTTSCVRQATRVDYAAASASNAVCSTFNAAYNAASNSTPDTVLVKAGNYGAFTPTTKSARVSFIAAQGESVALAASMFGTGNKNVTLDSMTLQGIDVGAQLAVGYAQNITIQNSTIMGQVMLRTNGGSNLNILIDNNKFMPWDRDYNGSPAEGRLSVAWPGGPNVQPDSGVIVSNNEFIGPGCSDGIQLGAAAVQIIGNVFHGINQHVGTRDCADPPSGAHVDAIQIYGAQRTVFRNNLIYDSTTGIINYNGGGDHTIADNNVIWNVEREDEALGLGGEPNPEITHNTTNGQINVAGATGAIVKDNVADSIWIRCPKQSDFGNNCGPTGTVAQNDHNLIKTDYLSSQYNSGGDFTGRVVPIGTGSILGAPILVGGSNYTTLANAELASNSPGYHKASDGKSMGFVLAVQSSLTKYVSSSGSDSNACTQAAPCQSFQKALSVCQSGDTISVSAGSYGTQSITATAPGAGCTLNANPGVTIGNLSMGGGNYTISNLVVDVGNVHAAGVYMNGSSITAKNVKVHGAYARVMMVGNSATWQGGELGEQGATPGQRNFCTGDEEPLTMQLGSNLTVDGITFWPQGTIADNACNHLETIRIDDRASGVTVKNSTFKPTPAGTAQIFITAPTTANRPSNILIASNIIFGSTTGSYTMNIHPQVGSCSDIKIAYNTLGQEISHSCTDLIKTGNLGSHPGPCRGVYTKNVWQNNSNPGCSSTDTWVNGTQFETDALGLDSTYHLTSTSKAINNGETTCTQLTGNTDIDGDTRPQGAACDAGADEVAGGTGTPTPKTGDLNADSQVNIFDLSILLSNYGKTKAQASNPACDLNNDSTINIFDLSILLSNYGK